MTVMIPVTATDGNSDNDGDGDTDGDGDDIGDGVRIGSQPKEETWRHRGTKRG